MVRMSIFLFILTAAGLLGILGASLVEPPAVVPNAGPGTQPSALSPITVVINAGDGGKEAPGAVVGTVKEKDVNLAIALKVLALSHEYPQLRVVLTRYDDKYLPHTERLRVAAKVGAALYLSIHTNAAPNSQARGVETWVDNARPPGDPSWRLAAAVQRAVVAATRHRDRGVRSQRLYLRHTRLPAALLETGFLTNPAERRLLLDPEHQTRIARGVLEGILDFLELSP